jgi:hypothetical protein
MSCAGRGVAGLANSQLDRSDGQELADVHRAGIQWVTVDDNNNNNNNNLASLHVPGLGI